MYFCMAIYLIILLVFITFIKRHQYNLCIYNFVSVIDQSLLYYTFLKHLHDNKCWQRWKEKETLVPCGQECKLVHLLWKTVGKNPQKTKPRTTV